jgi:protein-S-isoprenylcysteine O-methyltransferase Ste14
MMMGGGPDGGEAATPDTWRNRAVAALARRRVALGFLAAAAVFILAAPTWASWRTGLLVALAGEALRLWAAGHLEKSREVTSSGPYRLTRHPLYLGSSLIALGAVIAAHSLVAATLAAIYMCATVAAAVRTEEAFLRQRFGTAYDRYQQSAAPLAARRYSFARALRNREHRAVLGLAGAFVLLALKIVLPI